MEKLHGFKSDREFHLMTFVIGHSQTLLVSIDTTSQTRTEILFRGVAAVKLRRRYNGLVIRPAEPDELIRLVTETGVADALNRRGWFLESDNVTDYVVAGAAWLHEGPGDWGNKPHLANGNIRWPWPGDPNDGYH